MMDALTVLVLLGLGFYAVKKKLLPRLKKGRQETPVQKECSTALPDCRQLDFRILSFNTGDFTYTEDLAHCVEYELAKAVGELEKEHCLLVRDPFPIVIGSSLLVLLYYYHDTVHMEEVAG